MAPVMVMLSNGWIMAFHNTELVHLAEMFPKK